MKNNFLNFSANVKTAFENDETKYMGFSQLLKDYAKGELESGISKADADKEIRDTFKLIMGLDEKASAKEIRKAIRRNKNEIFEVIEETVEDLLASSMARFLTSTKSLKNSFSCHPDVKDRKSVV